MLLKLRCPGAMTFFPRSKPVRNSAPEAFSEGSKKMTRCPEEFVTQIFTVAKSNNAFRSSVRDLNGGQATAMHCKMWWWFVKRAGVQLRRVIYAETHTLLESCFTPQQRFMTFVFAPCGLL